MSIVMDIAFFEALEPLNTHLSRDLRLEAVRHTESIVHQLETPRCCGYTRSTIVLDLSHHTTDDQKLLMNAIETNMFTVVPNIRAHSLTLLYNGTLIIRIKTSRFTFM